MANLFITQKDHGKVFNLSVGEVLSIQLEENPTTGYQWSLDSLSNELFEIIKDEYYQNMNAMTGGGGVRKIQLKLKRRGEDIIHLTLRRVWEIENLINRLDIKILIQ